MATIVVRTRKDGSTAYVAQITRRAHGVQESRTFDKEKTAKTWANRREKEIDNEIANGKKPLKSKAKKITLGDAIDRYLADSMVEIGKTKAQVLRTIRTEYKIADMPCGSITSPDIVAFVKELHDRPDLNSPGTAGNYLSHLGAIFDIARPMWGLPLDAGEMKDAARVCKRLGLTARSAERTRRPTLDELDKLLTHFEAASAADPRCIPMAKVVLFAIFSTRRQDEICRITWQDYEEDERRVMVRDMKHPGQKRGNDVWVDLPDPCPEIIATMPRTKERIFPYNSDTISRRFTDACKVCEIDDLHFHDLRHEGASRLAEKGLTVPQLSAVTGHRSWKSLERYTHVRKIGDKFDGWPWIDRLIG